MALLELGARMMAGTSPYALQNIGTAGVGTLGSIREMQKERGATALKREELAIERAKLAKDKETDFRERLRIKREGTPEERAALREQEEFEKGLKRAEYGLKQQGLGVDIVDKARKAAAKRIEALQINTAYIEADAATKRKMADDIYSEEYAAYGIPYPGLDRVQGQAAPALKPGEVPAGTRPIAVEQAGKILQERLKSYKKGSKEYDQLKAAFVNRFGEDAFTKYAGE